MARQCSTPGCVLQQFHPGLCDTRGTRSLCKTSESAGKLEASRRDRFGVSGGIKKNRKGAGKMDPPRFDAGDRVEVYFNDRFWYPGTVVRWVRIPTQRTYKYEIRFDSGLQLPFERYPLERGVIAEGAHRPQIPDPVVPLAKPKTARLPPALPSGLASTPFRRIRFGDRVCVAWTATAHYYGVVRDTATRLEGKKTQRGIHVSYDDGTKTWHWEKDNDGMEVALIPTGPQAGGSAVVVYEHPGMNVADDSDESEAAAAPPPAPAPASATANEAKVEAMKKQMEEMKRQMQVQQQRLRDQAAMEAMTKEMEEMKRQMQLQQQELQDQAARLEARDEAASAQAAPPANEPSKTAIQTMDGGFMEMERLVDILHVMDDVPYLGNILQRYVGGAIDKGGLIVNLKAVVGGEKLRAALGEKHPPPPPTAPAPPPPAPAPAPAPTPPQQPPAAAPDEPTTVAHIVDVAGTACED